MNPQFEEDRNFTTPELAQYFDQSPQTIRSWSDEFAQFLSSYASSRDGRNRTYKIEDIRILKFIAGQRRKDMAFELIRELLRDAVNKDVATVNLPDITREDVETRLEIAEYSMQEFQMQLLLDELADQSRELERLRPLDKEATKLKILLEERERQINDLKLRVRELGEKIEAMQQEILDAVRREGNAYYRGRYDAVMETLNDKDDNTK